MIPILYSNTSNPKSLVTDTTTGLGRLDECISAVVTEERNGAYELEIEYPVNGVLFPQITCASWIKAKPFVDGDVQLFRVYSISKPVNGICTINAEHVSYMLTHALVLTGTDNTNPQSMLIADVFDTIENRASDIDPRYVYNGAWSFHFYCAKSASAQYFIMDKIRSIREWLLGSDYSILTVYGDGEYKFDNFDVYLYDADGGDHARGHDNGVKIQYGKNMLSLRMDESDDNVITLFYPYIIVYEDSNSSSQHNWFLKRDLKDLDPYLIDRYVANNHATGYTGMPRIKPLNLKDFEPWKDVTFGDYYSLPIDDQDLYECVFQYMDAHPECNSPKRSIDVSFVDLSSTDEYKNILPLQTINLCDIVTVEYPEWHINEKFKVVKTEYNVLEERYNKLTLGSLRNTLG